MLKGCTMKLSRYSKETTKEPFESHVVALTT
jgi:hypothetical protein